MKTSLYRSLLAALCVCWLSLPMPAPAQEPSAIPQREVAPGDLSTWRRFVLPNRMKVLLLSDPKLNVSSAALVVGAGSLDDPPNRAGLAHFLEHMVFLGTEKYPDITGFDAYLRRNSGVNNAYTADDRTNYFLEIRHEAFEGAIDRFAQFFIAPLFDARFTEREMNAVASEHQKNLENDGWREAQLRKLFYAAGHPARNFGTGSRETLSGVTRDDLLAFHRRYYSANRMALVLTGSASLDQLEAWARQSFAAVPDRDAPGSAPFTTYPAEYLPRKPALRVLRMEPIQDQRALHLEFSLPGLLDGWPHKSADLLAFVFGSEGPGSLLAQLKAEGLATTLAAATPSATRQYGSLELQIGLTPQGLERWQRVLALVLSTAQTLREQGLPAHLFAERRALARLDERYRDKGEGANLAAGLVSLLLDHPIDVAERVPYLWLREDRAAFAALADRIRPDNLLVVLIAKGQAAGPDAGTEPIYGTRYRYSEDTGAGFTALLAPPRVDGMHPPKPNPFIPQGTALRALEPTRLIDEPDLSLFHAQDNEFQRPQAATVLRLVLPRTLASARSAALLKLYEACVREQLNQTTYVAAEAGQRFTFSATLEGVLLATEGWDEANARLFDAVTPQIGDCTLSPARFTDLKDRIERELQAAETADAYISVRETRRSLMREIYYTAAELLAPTRRATLADVRALAKGLYARGKLEALVYGNVGADEARATLRRVAARLKTRALPEAQLLRSRQLVGRAGQALRSSEALLVNNSVLRREYRLGGDSAESRAAALMIGTLVGDPFYSEMRTRQQLGYVVQGDAFEDERQTIALFVIQSGDHPADELERRAESFIRTFPAQLAELPEDAWATMVAGVRARLLERDKSIAERAQRLFALAYDRGGDWSRRQATVAALDKLTRQRLGEILQEALDPARGQPRTFLGFARQHAMQGPAAQPLLATPAERVRWKRAQVYR